MLAYILFVLGLALGTSHAYVPRLYDFFSELAVGLSDTCHLGEDDHGLTELAKRVERAFVEIHVNESAEGGKTLTPKQKGDLMIQVLSAATNKFLFDLDARGNTDLAKMYLDAEFVFGNITTSHIENFFGLGEKTARRKRDSTKTKAADLPAGTADQMIQSVLSMQPNLNSSLLFEKLWRAGGSNNVKPFPFPTKQEDEDESKQNARSRFRALVVSAASAPSVVGSSRKRKNTPTKMTVPPADIGVRSFRIRFTSRSST